MEDLDLAVPSYGAMALKLDHRRSAPVSLSPLAVPSYGAMALKQSAVSNLRWYSCYLQSPPTGRWP